MPFEAAASSKNTRMRPSTILPGDCTMRIMERTVTLLPHPDSPTMP